MTGVFHLDYMISVQIQTLLDWFTKSAANIGSDGLPIWWWDHGIHRSDRLLHRMLMIDRVISTIGMRLCDNIVRGFVELCRVWEGIFFLAIPMIDSIHGLVDFDFTEMIWQDMI
jgi:hypothetical protein